MATNPSVLNPATDVSILAADVDIIEVQGADNDTGLQGFYVSDGGTPPIYTHTTASPAQTINFEGPTWVLDANAINQFTCNLTDNTTAPLSGISFAGTALVWTLASGTGPALPITVRRPSAPSTLTP